MTLLPSSLWHMDPTLPMCVVLPFSWNSMTMPIFYSVLLRNCSPSGYIDIWMNNCNRSFAENWCYGQCDTFQYVLTDFGMHVDCTVSILVHVYANLSICVTFSDELLWCTLKTCVVKFLSWTEMTECAIPAVFSDGRCLFVLSVICSKNVKMVWNS